MSCICVVFIADEEQRIAIAQAAFEAEQAAAAAALAAANAPIVPDIATPTRRSTHSRTSSHKKEEKEGESRRKSLIID